MKNKFPFWNVESLQFMYVLAFHFTALKGCEKYRYDVIDENNVKHSFESKDCCDLLTPIWREIPEGVVQLTVTALNKDGSDYSIVGARTFFKSASQDFVQHFLKHGTPSPYYDLNV